MKLQKTIKTKSGVEMEISFDCSKKDLEITNFSVVVSHKGKSIDISDVFDEDIDFLKASKQIIQSMYHDY